MPDVLDTPTEPAASPVVEGGAGVVVPSPVAAPAPAGGAVSEWNGERESLVKEPWWNEIPEPVRANVERGIATKYTNFHRGADRARSEAAARADAAEAALAAAKKDQDFYARLLNEDDSVKSLTTELSSLKESLGVKDAELATTKTQLAEYEARVEQAETQRVLSTHEAKYPDIYADFQADETWTPESGRAPAPTGAYVEFMKMVNAGIPEERAAKMIRATMDAPPAPVAAPVVPAPVVAPRPVVPPSIAAASTGAGPSPARAVRETNEGFDEIMLRKRREYEALDDGE